MHLYPLSGLLFLLGQFLVVSSSKTTPISDDIFEIETPEVIKDNFINAVRNRDLETAKHIAKENPFISSQFNNDVFAPIMNCYVDEESAPFCDQFFELIEGSFANLSKSKTTPLVSAVYAGNELVFNKLMTNPDRLIEVDQTGRNAFMYAARMGRHYMMLRMFHCAINKLENPAEFFNKTDKYGKSVLHFICEATKEDFDKLYWIKTLTNNGAYVVGNVPYAANVWDVQLRELITSAGGQVYQMNLDKMIETASAYSKIFVPIVLCAFRVKIMEMIVPILFHAWNNRLINSIQNVFMHLGQLALSGFDSNVVISFDLPSGIYHFTFNLLFIAFLALIFSERKVSPLRY